MLTESSSPGTSLKHICQPAWNTGPRWKDGSFTRVNHKCVLSLCQKAVHPESALIDGTVGVCYQKAAEFLRAQAHTGHWAAQEERRGAQQRGRRPALQHRQASQQQQQAGAAGCQQVQHRRRRGRDIPGVPVCGRVWEWGRDPQRSGRLYGLASERQLLHQRCPCVRVWQWTQRFQRTHRGQCFSCRKFLGFKHWQLNWWYSITQSPFKCLLLDQWYSVNQSFVKQLVLGRCIIQSPSKRLLILYHLVTFQTYAAWSISQSPFKH